MEQYMHPIHPFSPQQPLPASVESDHVPVAVQLPDKQVLMYYNISNPAHHHYFGQSEQHPLYHTHMRVTVPYDEEGELDSWLQKKVDSQLTCIAEELKSGKVAVYVIIEGYYDFYNRLLQLLNPETGKQEFGMHCHWRSDKRTSNETAIIYNRNVYGCVKCISLLDDYQEEGQERRRQLVTHCVQLKNKTVSYEFVVAAVHVPGCASQYPKIGLSTLAAQLHAMRRDEDWWMDILAVGDYNTPPEGVKEAIIDQWFGSHRAHLLQVPYDTHVNPNGFAGVYDHTLWLQSAPYILSSQSICAAGQVLQQALYDHRRK